TLSLSLSLSDLPPSCVPYLLPAQQVPKYSKGTQTIEIPRDAAAGAEAAGKLAQAAPLQEVKAEAAAASQVERYILLLLVPLLPLYYIYIFDYPPLLVHPGGFGVPRSMVSFLL